MHARCWELFDRQPREYGASLRANGVCSARRLHIASFAYSVPPETVAVSGLQKDIDAKAFVNATQPYTGAQARAWGAALTLVVIAFIAMLVARFFTARFTKNSR